MKEILTLAAPPQRIECYDISNTQGTNSVGAMVVFEAGRPRPGEYRRFKIKSVVGPYDFASHQDVLRRRFRGVSTLAGAEASDSTESSDAVEASQHIPAHDLAIPDLIIIDGGKCQVRSSLEFLQDCHIS